METERWGVICPRLPGGGRQSQGLNSWWRRFQKGCTALPEAPGKRKWNHPLFSWLWHPWKIQYILHPLKTKQNKPFQVSMSNGARVGCSEP